VANIRERRTTAGTVWDVRWRVRERDGWRFRTYTARSHDEAILARIAVERGEDPRRALPDATTFAAAWDSWHARWSIGKAPKTLRTARSARDALEPLAETRLASLNRAMVEDLVADVAREAPRSAQLALAHAKRMLRDAAGRDHAIDRRILEIPSPAYEEKQIRFLTWDEVERLAAYLDPHVHRIVPFAALTGMRRGEIFALTDRQVDLGASCITLRVTKTRKPRRVWLSAEAKKLLREQLLARTPNRAGAVFTTRSGAPLGSRFEASYRTAVEVAGLEGATFHALRHTCASLMIASGANPLEVAEQLGHMRKGKPDATMIWQRYGWLYEGATKAAVLRLDALISGRPA
jgi:integrase